MAEPRDLDLKKDDTRKTESINEMSWTEIEKAVLGEVELAVDHVKQVSDRRQRNWARYRGDPLGNEVVGRSRYVSRDVIDKINWLMPHLLNTFAAGDPKIRLFIQDKPASMGVALMQRIQRDLMDAEPSLYRVFNDWFIDALVSGAAFVKIGWNEDVERVEQTIDQADENLLRTLEADPNVEILDLGDEVMSTEGLTWRNVRMAVMRYGENRPYAEPVPPWEVLWHPNAREMDDEWPKGHRTFVTIDYLKRINQTYGGDFFSGLDEIEKTASKSTWWEHGDAMDAERSAYTRFQTGRAGSMDETGPRRVVELVEWYTRLDTDGDGFLESIVCWLADKRLIRVEQNERGTIPLIRCCPIREPHNFVGASFAEMVADLQNIKTMVVRQTLDHLAFHNSGRWLVDPTGNVDVVRLLTSSPGDVIYGRQGSVTPLAAQPVPIREPMAILEYCDSVLENRTGLTRYNQGTDADTLNRTATGIMRIQEAGMVRVHSIAQMIAEDALRPFYRKIAEMYQDYAREPIVERVHGVDVTIRPEDLQGRIQCRIDLGLNAMIEQAEVGRLDKIVQFLFAMIQHWPGIVSPEGAYNLAVRFLDTLGMSDHGMILPPKEAFIQQLQQASQAQQQAQAAMQRLAEEKERALAASRENAIRQKDTNSLRDFVTSLLSAPPTPIVERLLAAVDPLAVTQPISGRPEPTAQPNVLMSNQGQVPPDLVAMLSSEQQPAPPEGAAVQQPVPPGGAAAQQQHVPPEVLEEIVRRQQMEGQNVPEQQ